MRKGIKVENCALCSQQASPQPGRTESKDF